LNLEIFCVKKGDMEISAEFSLLVCSQVVRRFECNNSSPVQNSIHQDWCYI